MAVIDARSVTRDGAGFSRDVDTGRLELMVLDGYTPEGLPKVKRVELTRNVERALDSERRAGSRGNDTLRGEATRRAARDGAGAALSWLESVTRPAQGRRRRRSLTRRPAKRTAARARRRRTSRRAPRGSPSSGSDGDPPPGSPGSTRGAP